MPTDALQPLNCDRDAARWAREFNDVLAKEYNLRVDEGWLLGWFANAMMCGEDTYRWRVEQEDAAALRAAPPTNNADALSAAIERERLANMRADQAEEALAAVQQVQSIELERLREFQAKVEEAEARCCPEDVGFEEWIGELERRLGGTNAMASQAIGLLRQAYGHVALTAKLGSPHATTLAAELDAFLDTLPQPTNKELE